MKSDIEILNKLETRPDKRKHRLGEYCDRCHKRRKTRKSGEFYLCDECWVPVPKRQRRRRK